MKKLLILLLSLFIFLNGCQVEKQVISYTVYPIGYLLDRIGGNRVETISLQKQEMIQRAQAVEEFDEILKRSSLLFHLGELEPYLDVNRSNIEKSKVITNDLSSNNAIYEFKRYTRVYVDGKESYIEGPYYNSKVFDTIDVNTKDLHLWLDPISMISMAKEIKTYLASNYVEQSSYFNENYDKLVNDLVRLDAQYQLLAQKCKDENKSVKFVSMSASFGNWQKAYGFQVYPVILSKYGVLPNQEQLSVIKSRIIENEVKYIAYEPNMTEDMIALFNELESELHLTRVNLSNISSLTSSQENDNKDYLSIMYENLNVLENMITENVDVNTEEVQEDAEAVETEKETNKS